MKKWISYEDAKRVCEKYDNFHFYEYNHRIDGYKLAGFKYFICGWNDFADPLGDNA